MAASETLESAGAVLKEIGGETPVVDAESLKLTAPAPNGEGAGRCLLDRAAGRDVAQVALHQRRISGQRYRMAAEPLHGENCVGKTTPGGKRFTSDADAAQVEAATFSRDEQLAQPLTGRQRIEKMQIMPLTN